MNHKKIFFLSLVTIFALTSTGLAFAAGDAAAGEKKATAQCASCHGANGEGVGENPKLAGMDKAKFIKAMNDYKTGAKKHMMMEMFAKKLNDQDNEDLAAFYAAKK